MSDLNALDLEPGQIVGGYTLISRLGGGAMGSVWRVKDDGGQVYAMKILRDSLKDEGEEADGDGEDAGTDAAADAQNATEVLEPDGEPSHHHHSHNPHVTARERLRREAMALRRVKHPGVCEIVDMELDDSLAFIVTELIEGRNLRDDVAANGRYEGEDLERLARKLIEAVRAVHAQGVIHRDIKPTNIMVSAAGPVLVDFGIAMSAGESHVTRTGLVMGTPGFIAPEIIDGAESSEATDWWSLASVLAFAATGRPVFGSKPMMAVLEREASGSADLAGLPARTLEAFRAALNPDPARRCTPEALLEAITLDSLNPFSQGDEDFDDDMDMGAFGGASGTSGDAGNNGADGNENGTAGDNSNGQGAMHPFRSGGMAASAPPPPARNNQASDSEESTSSSNPRTLWRDDKSGQEAMTQILQTKADSGDTSATEVLANNGSRDAVRPQATRPLATRTMTANAADTGNPDAPSEQTMAIQPPETLTQAFPALGHNVVQAGRPALRGTNEGEAYWQYQQRQQPQPMPAPGTDPSPAVAPSALQLPSMATAYPIAPNPADVRWRAIISRSTLPLWLLAVPFTLLAAPQPTITTIAMVALVWILLSIGYSELAQLRREQKRGGVRKKRDTALRVIGLPWHVLKALIFTVPRALMIIAIAWMVPIIVDVVSGLPTVDTLWTIGNWNFMIAMPAALGPTWSGVMESAFALFAWILTVFAARPTIIQIGMGTLWGAKRGATDDGATAIDAQNPGPAQLGEADDAELDESDEALGDGKGTSKPHLKWKARRWVMLIIWAVVIAAAIALLAQGRQIDFTPLPTPQM
ncbi:serine/threonine-protein kinase [Bifidobacterium sp. ESL0790]|uniref:serine/threonine-protein kinase n=1 Tax=Bifidobacterium sp. ESL0790 TaxID=2983233 RepID=UPI0023F9DA07|nr:serine/threonine-protein kinase [Bifidobacterium sp. ESL0790]WEV72471.1 serine/threonine-protein kinase [Bifidobacterium sp. ESL0790]